jgi:hypothetical protein
MILPELICNEKNLSLRPPEQLRGAVVTHLRFIQKLPDPVCSYLNHATIKYRAYCYSSLCYRLSAAVVINEWCQNTMDVRDLKRLLEGEKR